MQIKEEIEKIVLDYTDGWNEPHFIEWFGEGSPRGPAECIERLALLFEKYHNQRFHSTKKSELIAR